MIKSIIAAVISTSIIVTLIELNRKKIYNKARFVSYERTRTDVSKKMRKLIPSVYLCNNRSRLIKLLPQIKACLNPYDFTNVLYNNKSINYKNIEHDVLLWNAIYELENDDKYDSEKEFITIRTKIGLYISCWLKYDWDRYHHEINKNDKKDYRQKFINAICSIYNNDDYSKDNLTIFKDKININELE